VWVGILDTHPRLREDVDNLDPYVGWLMYLSKRMGQVPPLLAPASITPIENKGTLIIVTPERYTATNPAHVKAADWVAAALNRAGLRKRIAQAGVPGS
jgi:hypothetical protein